MSTTTPISPDLHERAEQAIVCLRNGGSDDPYVIERSATIDLNDDNDDGVTRVACADDCTFALVPPFEGQPMLSEAYAIAGAGKLIAELLAALRAIEAHRDALAERQRQAQANLDAALRVIARAPLWIAVSERLPTEDGEYTVVLDHEGPAHGWWKDGAWLVQDSDCFEPMELVPPMVLNCAVTHWMPLPAAPKSGP